MDHTEILRALAGYVDGSLGLDEQAAVEEHLKTCSSCAASLLELRKTHELVRSLEKVPAPAWMTQKIMARVREEAEKKKFWSGWAVSGFRIPAGVLGMVFLAVTVFILSRNMQPEYRFTEQAPVLSEAPAPARAPGERRVKGESAPRSLAYNDEEQEDAASALPDKAAPRRAGTAAPQRPASAASPAQETGPEARALLSAPPERILLIRIRGRGTDARARIEKAVTGSGGSVATREVSSESWVMTVKIEEAKHAELMSALRQIGRTQERTMAIDGREGREILINGVTPPKTAVGC